MNTTRILQAPDATSVAMDYLISKPVEEEIIPNRQNEAGEYIIF